MIPNFAYDIINEVFRDFWEYRFQQGISGQEPKRT